MSRILTTGAGSSWPWDPTAVAGPGVLDGRPATNKKGQMSVNEHLVARLIDEQRIIDVAVQYAWAVDARNWDEFKECFTDDARGYYSRELSSYAQIEANAKRLDGLLTVHTVTNFHVTISGDSAQHRCRVTAFHHRAGTPGGDDFTIVGSYQDRFTRTDDRWRISHRRFERVHEFGNPAVVPPPTEAHAPQIHVALKDLGGRHE